jgi:hypothetical protein
MIINKYLQNYKNDYINNIINNHNFNWYLLSKHKDITWEIVNTNLDKPWNWDHLSSHPNITWDIYSNK